MIFRRASRHDASQRSATPLGAPQRHATFPTHNERIPLKSRWKENQQREQEREFAQALLLRILMNHGPLSTRDLGERADMTTPAAGQYLKRLRQEGKVQAAMCVPHKAVLTWGLPDQTLPMLWKDRPRARARPKPIPRQRGSFAPVVPLTEEDREWFDSLGRLSSLKREKQRQRGRV